MPISAWMSARYCMSLPYCLFPRSGCSTSARAPVVMRPTVRCSRRALATTDADIGVVVGQVLHELAVLLVPAVRMQHVGAGARRDEADGAVLAQGLGDDRCRYRRGCRPGTA